MLGKLFFPCWWEFIFPFLMWYTMLEHPVTCVWGNLFFHCWVLFFVRQGFFLIRCCMPLIFSSDTLSLVSHFPGNVCLNNWKWFFYEKVSYSLHVYLIKWHKIYMWYLYSFLHVSEVSLVILFSATFHWKNVLEVVFENFPLFFMVVCLWWFEEVFLWYLFRYSFWCTSFSS